MTLVHLHNGTITERVQARIVMLSVYEFQRKCIAVFSVTKKAIQEWDKEVKKKDSIVTLNTLIVAGGSGSSGV